MSAPLFIIVGRLRSTGKAELRVAYSVAAYKAEIINMSEMLALPWARRGEMSSLLPTLKWLKHAERRELARRIKAVTDLAA